MELAAPPIRRRHALLDGLHCNWPTFLLIAAINTGIALVLWLEDTRPFWHPFVSVQLYGFSIAYCVNTARPWDKDSPILRLFSAAAIGALIGTGLIILVKRYSLDFIGGHHWFLFDILTAFINGLLISLIFFVKFRETRATAAKVRLPKCLAFPATQVLLCPGNK